MWVMALRDEDAALHMERMYSIYRSVLKEIIAARRPDLASDMVADLALTLSASIEGHTVFIGHNRQHQGRAPQVKKLLIKQLIDLVENTRP